FFSMAYPQLMALYNWQGTSGNSMEWMLRSQTIPYGKSFKTSVSLCAFAGMPRLDGAKGALAGAFTRVNGELSGIKLYAAEGFSGTLTVSVRKHPALLKTTAATLDLALAAGSTTTRGFAHPVQGDGTFAVVATVQHASGEEALQFEVPVVRGDTSVTYAMPPESNRLGSDQERFGKLIKNASDTVDPYEYSAKIPSEGRTKWCKPYAGGTIKLLALAHMHVAREVIEISERMDVDLRTCTFFTVGKGPWNATWGHNGGHAEINAYFAKAMAEDYDVILIAAPDLKYLAKENIALLAKKVRSGTGLVTTMPRQIPDSCKDLFPALPLIETSYKTADPAIRSVKTYAPGEDAGFATALPLAGLPEIHVYPYAAKPDSNVLVTADGAPLIVCGTAGKGRSAVLTWLVGQPTNTSFGGLNPHFLEDPAYPWHEYYYAMTIKAVRWAANREPAVALSAVGVRPGAVRLSLSSSLKAAHRAKVEIVMRHESGRQIARFVRETTVAPGSTTVDLKTDYAPMAGRNFADVRLLSDGAVLDFGAGVLTHSGPGIAGIATPERVLESGEVLTATVTLRGDIRGCAIRAELVDNLGRRQAQTETEAAPHTKLTMPLTHLYAHAAYLNVQLVRDGRALDQDRAEILLAPMSLTDRAWDQYRVMLAWDRRSTRSFPYYLHGMRARALREFGVNAQMQTGVPVWWGLDQEQKYYLSYRQNFPLVMESMARFNSKQIPGFPYRPYDYRWGKDAFFKAREGYNETHDKKFLKRNPVLEDPVYRAAFKEAMRAHMQSNLLAWHPIGYDIGDESSYTYFRNAFDFDFSDISLAEFRKWLQADVYADLAALNREWETDFANWADVLPLTADEARESGKWSSWSDHRTYNEVAFADFVGFIGKSIKELDAGAEIAISGTQLPGAYGGWDYTRLMEHFDSISAYTSGGLPDIYRSYSKRTPLMAWWGYSSSENDLSAMLWRCIFSGHFGVAVYNEDVILNPDLTLTERGRWMKRILDPVLAGAGALVWQAEGLRPLVAVHYSQRSHHAAWIAGSDGVMKQNREGWIALLNELGVGFVFVGSREIEAGALESRGFKAFILPWSQAVSDRESAALHAFAKGGGYVVADQDAGIMNGHCRTLETNRLGSLLSGKQGVRMGALMDGYTPGSGKNPMKSKLSAVFRKASIRRPFDVLTSKGDAYPCYPFRLGERGLLAGILGQKPEMVSWEVEPGMHCYDVLAGKACPDGKVQVRAFQPQLLVQLPYEIKGITADCTVGGGKITVDGTVATTADAGTHVLRFDVFDGATLRREYSRVVHAPTGRASWAFYPSLDEHGREWTVRITDVMSGLRARVNVTLN
ncbi:MAG: hypothetical protein HN849_14495, partial [Victivallales bacterium]|nr:hypothetical protein [Victivallales bacterium]